jgi:hypothetical protein
MSKSHRHEFAIGLSGVIVDGCLEIALFAVRCCRGLDCLCHLTQLVVGVELQEFGLRKAIDHKIACLIVPSTYFVVDVFNARHDARLECVLEPVPKARTDVRMIPSLGWLDEDVRV